MKRQPLPGRPAEAQPGAASRLVGRGLLAGVIAVILLATLTPYPGQPRHPLSWCLTCGDHGTADAFANVLLFMPLGIACVILGWRRLGSIAGAALLSGAIETVQLVLPGRDPSVSDLLCNTAGAPLGMACAIGAMRLRRRPPRWAPAAAAVCVAAAVAIEGALFRAAPPSGEYYGQWTAQLGHLGNYDGRVLGATIGGMAVPNDRLPDSRALAALLRASAPVEVDALAGPASTRLAPLFSIFTGTQQEVLLVGFDGADLVYRYAMMSQALRLDEPDVRVRAAAAGITPAELMLLRIERQGPGLCFSLNARRTCGLGQSPGRLWAALFYSTRLGASAGRMLDALCIALLLLPLGFTVRRDRWSAAALLVALSALFLMPPWVGLLRPAPLEAVAAGLALLLPVLFRFYRRAVGSSSPSAINARASSATHRSMRA